MGENQQAAVQVCVVETEVTFTVGGLCKACGADRGFLVALVDEGVLQPAGHDPASWQFSGSALRTARAATNLSRDLDLNPAGIALVLDLLAHIDALTTRLRNRA